MRKRVISIIVAIALSALGLSQLQIDMLSPFIDRLLPSAEASSPVPNVSWERVPFDFKLDWYALSDINSEVGALRPPSAHSRADRSCYYCHGFHGDKYQSTRAIALDHPVMGGSRSASKDAGLV